MNSSSDSDISAAEEILRHHGQHNLAALRWAKTILRRSHRAPRPTNDTLPHCRDEKEYDKSRETEQALGLHAKLDRECAAAIARDGGEES